LPGKRAWPHGDSLAAEGLDDLLGVADLLDAQSKILADFDGLAQGDDFVVHQEFQRAIAAFEKLDDGPRSKAHDFAAMHFSFGQADDQRNLQAEDSIEFSPV
jgi:hypothetical protein